MSSRVTLERLSKAYGGVAALQEFDLAVEPGELVSLLGPSGCGKTTALRVLAGLETADSGRVLVADRDVTGVPASKRDMGMVFQAYSLFPHLTALDNVAFGLRLRKVASGARRTRAGELLELVGLSSSADKYPHQMSGGQQQRVALARALAVRPQVLLLDEPLSALDAQVRVQLREEIRRLQTDLGITTVFVTHDQEEALAVSDRVGVMSGGRLEQLGSPAEVYQRPATPFVASFVGVTSRLSGTVQGAGLRLASGALVPAAVLAGRPDGSPASVLVRPADLRVAEGGLTGVVQTVAFLGPVTRLSVRLDGGDVVRVDIASERMGGVDAPAAGTRLPLLLDPAAALDAG